MKYKLLIIFKATTTVATTTPTPNAFCALRAAGRYAASGTGCKKYMYCYLSNGFMLGAMYTCSGTTYFNPDSLLCVTTYVCPDAPASTTTTTVAATTTTTLGNSFKISNRFIFY